MVKMRPAAIAMLDQPVPTLLPALIFFEFHRSCGPLLGHSLSKFVSVLSPSRCGPRHCGHSCRTRDGSCAPTNEQQPKTTSERTRMECSLTRHEAGGEAGRVSEL